jgi:3-hydroxyacyl-CoA dehydrogenase
MNNGTLLPVVHHALHGGVMVLTLDHPPVNALSAAVRSYVLSVLESVQTDPAVRAILLIGAGRNFTAGADIREFGKPAQAPTLSELCNRIEASAKIVIAAVHGAVLGGGLELALAAHYRLALPNARMGLPEVSLGLLPGAGGTQRAPRLMGAASALDLMLSGRQLPAQEALSFGLIDLLADGNHPQSEGLAYAEALLAANVTVRRTRDAQGLADRSASLAAIEAARNGLQKARGLFSPGKIVEATQAALDLPFEEGLAFERQSFLACMESPQRAGLTHAFFAEREVVKSPETLIAQPRALASIGVVGGGTMGAAIAVAALDAGLPVTMVERDDASLVRGRANVEKVYDTLIVKGRLTQQSKADKLERLSTSTSYEALADVDLVIEAVFEDMAVKKTVFAELDRVCRPDAVLASNTSYLDIEELAHSVSRPQNVVGLHFFSPANIMKLLEIIVPSAVSADVVATAFELAKQLRKVPVRAGVCDGFIGNRIMAVYRQAAEYLMEDGASPYEIDEAVREFGFPMGPFQVTDLAGGDIAWATRKRRAATRDPEARYVHIADRLCEQGWFGQKTGRGYYLYPQGSRAGIPDPEVEAIIDEERRSAGITLRHFASGDILRRYLAAMVNEGANVVEQGIALRPLDVDVTLLYGYGFPRWRGGPMQYADTVGLPAILADIHEFAQEDSRFWRASPLLERLVAEGRDFSSLNRMN